MKPNIFIPYWEVETLLSGIDNNIDNINNWSFKLKINGITLKLDFDLDKLSNKILVGFIFIKKEGLFYKKIRYFKYEKEILLDIIDINPGFLGIEEVKVVINSILSDIKNNDFSHFVEIS